MSIEPLAKLPAKWYFTLLTPYNISNYHTTMKRKNQSWQPRKGNVLCPCVVEQHQRPDGSGWSRHVADAKCVICHGDGEIPAEVERTALTLANETCNGVPPADMTDFYLRAYNIYLEV